MWDLIKIFLFSNAVWLSAGPMSVTPTSPAAFSKTEISAINSGAHLLVDVTEMMPADARVSLTSAREWVQENIPEGSVSATLQCPECDGRVELAYQGQNSWDGSSMSISLDHVDKMPVGNDFTGVTVRSTIPLRKVRIQWVNYSK